MENFARVIGALDEYSIFNLMQNALDFKLEQSAPLSFMPVRARENVTSFFCLTNKDRLQLFCYKPVFCHQCVE